MGLIGATCDRGDRAVPGDPANAVIAGIGNVQVTGSINRQAGGCVALCVEGGSSIAAEVRRPIPGDGRYRSVQRNLSQAVVPGIRDVEVTGSIYRHTVRAGKLRVDRATAVARIAGGAGPRDSGDSARGRYLSLI